MATGQAIIRRSRSRCPQTGTQPAQTTSQRSQCLLPRTKLCQPPRQGGRGRCPQWCRQNKPQAGEVSICLEGLEYGCRSGHRLEKQKSVSSDKRRSQLRPQVGEAEVSPQTGIQLAQATSLRSQCPQSGMQPVQATSPRRSQCVHRPGLGWANPQIRKAGVSVLRREPGQVELQVGEEVCDCRQGHRQGRHWVG